MKITKIYICENILNYLPMKRLVLHYVWQPRPQKVHFSIRWILLFSQFCGIHQNVIMLREIQELSTFWIPGLKTLMFPMFYHVF